MLLASILKPAYRVLQLNLGAPVVIETCFGGQSLFLLRECDKAISANAQGCVSAKLPRRTARSNQVMLTKKV
jgi:hypothetical protein